MADIREFKNAAKTAAEYLQRDGIEVQSAKMLEALARAFGGRNWVSFRESLPGVDMPGDKLDPVNQLASTLKQLIDAMEMQELREREEIHLSQPAAQAVWNTAKSQGRTWLEILKGLQRESATAGLSARPSANSVSGTREEEFRLEGLSDLKEMVRQMMYPLTPVDKMPPWEHALIEESLNSVWQQYRDKAQLSHVHAFLMNHPDARARDMAYSLSPWVTGRYSRWFGAQPAEHGEHFTAPEVSNQPAQKKPQRLDFSHVPPDEFELLVLSKEHDPLCCAVLVNYATGDIFPMSDLPEWATEPDSGLLYRLCTYDGFGNRKQYRAKFVQNGKIFRFVSAHDFVRFQKAYEWVIEAYRPVTETKPVLLPKQVAGTLVIRFMDETESSFPATLSLQTREVQILWTTGDGPLCEGAREWEKFIFEDADGDEFPFAVFRDEDGDLFVEQDRVDFVVSLIEAGRTTAGA
jgi:hypothetical protein